MGKIDLTINKEGLAHNIKKAKENGIIIPTIAEMQHPETIPEKIQEKLKSVGMWDVNPLNLFRITWKNQPKVEGALFQAVPNYVEIPSVLSGPAASSRWPASGSPPAAIRSALRSAASLRDLSPASSTSTSTRLSGPPPATTAAAARSTPACSARRASPFSRPR